MNPIPIILAMLFTAQAVSAQISAKLMRYMDLSDEQITFVYGGDIWVMPKEGGTAVQVTRSPGEESWPRFSPDGNHIAFTASYDGNPDVYVIPAGGGVPVRVTHHSGTDRLVDWHPDGERLLFASRREMGQRSGSQFFMVDRKGGMPVKLPVPYGELASFSPDGGSMAYITKITENYPFKRYRGGLSSDILVYDFSTGKVDRITENPAIDGKPAWVGDEIFFLSDRGEKMRMNVWVYDTLGKDLEQVTFMEEFDISFLSGNRSELVFETGGSLYLMDAATRQYNEVKTYVVSDLSLEMPRREDVSKRIVNVTASPYGKRVIFEARGELFNVPVKEGYVLNLTRSSGAFDMLPAWSPDGEQVAYWSDRSGEYELYVQPPGDPDKSVQLTRRGKGFGYRPHWSPDSKRIAFIDETNTLRVVDVSSKEVTVAGNYGWNYGHGSRYGFPIAWSPDSRWIAFTEGLENAHNAIFLYGVESGEKHRVTSGFYDDSHPLFSVDGKYLYFLSDRGMNATYSDLGDGTWVYPNATQVAVMALEPGTPSLLKPKNDEVKKEEQSDKKDKEEKPEKKKEDESGKKDETEEVKIDFNRMEERVEILPPKPGNISWIASFKDKLVFLRRPNTGAASRTSSLLYFDLKEREEKTILPDVQEAQLTADGKQLLVRVKGKYGIIKAAEKQKVDKPISTTGLVMDLVPKEEWRQIFDDTWRRHRDFFYDSLMHGVDWAGLRERYGALIEDARSRWDVSQITSNLAAELSAGHTYTFGGDVEIVNRVRTGLLGIDWEMGEKAYRVGRIVRPASWDTENRSPFDRPGVEVKEGDFIHMVNGIPVDPAKDPYASFEGLSGKTVVLSVSSDGEAENARQVVVKCLSPREEANLRYLEWIEDNRRLVDSLSGGKLGYVYMSNTSSQGQRELVRMYYGQLDRQGFIIDERFNGGGQLADRFMELLLRPVVYNLHWRHGRDHTHPIKTNTGPMGMLINGWAGSGGDGLPWAFQELEAGPIVGERTLGILVGPATGHMLIDGGGITVPGARLYDNDGHWFWEGEGVAPDIEVWDDPNILMKGRDPQIERVVREVLQLLEESPPEMTPAPRREDRTPESLRSM